MDQGKILKEACVESLQEAIMAEKNGADRIELCAELNLGGTTPGYHLIEKAKAVLKIPIMVMIRPRGGNFIYNPMEIRLMKQSIDICKQLEVLGVVFGILDDKKQIDPIVTGMLADYSKPLKITFHKAIDETPEPVESVKLLNKIPGITRILTSGGKATAIEGAPMISKMIKKARPDLIIIAAGKVTHENLHEISKIIPATEFHGRRIVKMG